MAFMDKLKSVGKGALKSVFLAANDWCGKVSEGAYKDTDIKELLVATSTETDELVLCKGVSEVVRIPTDEIGAFIISPEYEKGVFVLEFIYKGEDKRIVSIHTKIAKTQNSNKVPGVYLDTRAQNYIKFIDFFAQRVICDEETEKEIANIKSSLQ